MNLAEVHECVRKIKSSEEEREKVVAEMCLNFVEEALKDPQFEKVKEDLVFSIIASDPGNPLLFNFMKKILKAKTKKEVQKIVSSAKEYISRVPVEVSRLWDRVIRDECTVLTHSYSTNVQYILKKAAENIEFEVLATEGSPNFRGKKLADQLSKAGINVTLIPDTAVNYMMPEVDVVLLGGLAVTRFGLIAPVGASMVALSARWNKVPVYAAVELLKVSERIIIKELPLRDVPAGIHARSPGYDLTRSELLSAYLTEDGVVEPEKFYSLATTKLERW